MKNVTRKEWAKIMLEMDLKSQEGSIWNDDNCKKEKVLKYKEENLKAIILSPDPIYYNGKVIKSLPPDII